jgi:predicted secreted protein
MSHYIVQTSAARMPGSCWGQYRRVAVLEVEDGLTRAAMISSRARGVRSVVQTWERCHVGTTSRGAYQRALAEAEALAARLNAQHKAA